ncbi:MAG TPA: DegQ family serine endoprotease, partial [Vicinamibacteria bacterium]|nr:DegQ family serine endoprotease [Vicinamibacteria bacterium]
MRSMRDFSRSYWLPLAAIIFGGAAFWQVGPASSAAATASVDEVGGDKLAGAPSSFADIVETVQPSVVNIAVSGGLPVETAQGVPFDNFEDFLRRFFDGAPGRPDVPEAPRAQRAPRFRGMGSGFLVGPEGYVVTNQHVVRNASEIQVTLHDGRKLPAELVGIDEKTDLAVVKVQSDKELPYARFGDSDATRVGDWVVAIGNPFGLGGSATAGIVSARGRDIQSGPFDDFFQIDAPINQGNSGGPLFNLKGEVIGINTAIFSPNGGNVGIGFAIPSNLAKGVIAELRETGRVERGFLGVTIQPVDEEIAESLGLPSEEGALVANVVQGGPADKAGVRAGDVIVSIDGHDIAHVKELTRKIADLSPDAKAELVVLRDGQRKNLEVRIGKTPSEAEPRRADASATPSGLGLTLSELTPSARAQFGIPEDVEGALVVDVDPASGAAEKGLKPGDVIVSVGQKAVSSLGEVKSEIQRQKAAERESVLLRVVRGGE